MNYYNEIDPYPAQWLRNLATAGHIPPGTVDDRSIADVRADDLVGHTQAHFFAGIGGWPYALRLAGWPDDQPVWTGSCPCQPFSNAGEGRGVADERHLWPAFRRLIAESCPPTVFGEQVASDAGREWLAAVRADCESLGYAFWAIDLCAASVGAPHIRQRLYWVAYRGNIGEISGTHRMGHPVRPGLAWRKRKDLPRTGGGIEGRATEQSGRSFWSMAEYLECSDGRSRPTQPGLCPVVDGLPSGMGHSRTDRQARATSDRRIGQIKGYGNAIVPQVGAVFVRAVMECILQETE